VEKQKELVGANIHGDSQASSPLAKEPTVEDYDLDAT
jgi:hypothetical protein